MKIYLAGPMRGLPDFNFPEFHKYAALLRAEGHEVFNPAELGLSQSDMRAILAVELDWICREADAVALMPGWSESLGARAEAALARALNLKLMGVPDFHPTRPLGKLSQSELEFSTTSHLHLLKSLKFPSPDKSNMGPPAGIGRSLLMKLTPSYVITFSVGLLIAMACYTLQKWLGGH